MTTFVHHVPISSEVFARHYMLIAQTFNRVFSGGLGTMAAPRVMAFLLKDVAKAEGREAEANDLMNEIRRLTNVLTPDANGYSMMPLYDAIKSDVFTDEEVSEVESACTFFTVVSRMHSKTTLAAVLESALGLWAAESTSLSVTDYRASLQMLTVAESSGATAAVSSVPS